jgi:N-acetylmuramoyl-L-alanine amidase
MKKLIFISLLIFYSLGAMAQANLTDINSIKLSYNEYKITFALSNQVDFKVVALPKKNKITIDFNDSKFAAKAAGAIKKIDRNYIKNIFKSTQNSKNLRISLELAEGVKLYKSYAIARDGKLFTTIELKNNHLKPEVLKSLTAKKFIIMIDPGHGGTDSGTVGSNPNILEKNIALEFAQELKAELSKYPSYEVIMTRDADKSISLNDRKKKSNQVKADIFISLHADSNPDSKMQGASVYTLSQESLDEEAKALSERENKSAILKNDQLLQQNQEIANVLIDMVYHDTKNSSVMLAQVVAKNLSGDIKMMHKLHRCAGFKVLKGVDIPAILVEIGYLSNKDEEKLLTSYMYKKIFARSMAQGVNEYVNQVSKKN